MTFSADLATYIKRTNKRAADVQAAAGLQIAEKIITRTPVDTGRARGNWNFQVGAIDDSTRSVSSDVGSGAKAPQQSPAGREALARATQKMGDFKPGTILYITNGLPYIRRLEYDAWSKQAPAGMVRITAEEFAQAVRSALNGIS